ncbi:hypothetical protein [Argonema antarcticum]|uniref:hypothetical protein n=1 Tax=Argonema antarcticum TaxID=2942763 RepID=UPI00201144DB|nr:hypothetical protein [Argonema antarcticum A004/B2]
MTNSKPEDINHKSVVLTDPGYQKLITALNKKFPQGYVIQQIAAEANIHRTTFTRILERKLGVLFQKIDNLFSYLDIDLEYLDVKSPNNTTQTPNNNKTKSDPKLEELRDSLLQLNYKKQCKLLEDFRERENNCSRGAFLIQGEAKKGQRWLVNRLVKQNFPYVYKTDNMIPILPHHTKEKDFHIDEVWKQLGEKLGLKKATSEKCVDAAFRRWQSGSLIVTFYADNIYKEIPKLINDFWIPLEKKVDSYTDEEIEYYLLVFLIDSNNCATQWELEIVDSDNPNNWHPQKLISLPKIDNFGNNYKEILSWCTLHRNLLGCPENSSTRVKDVAKQIWDNSQGVPEDTFHQICQIVSKGKLSWSQFEAALEYKL